MARNAKSNKNRQISPFTLFPNPILYSTEIRELSDHAFRVYFYLLSKYKRSSDIEKEFNVDASHTVIERESGVCHSQVVRGMKELKQHKFIEVKIMGGLYGRQNYSTYILTKEKVFYESIKKE